MANERQRECILGLDPRQARRGVEKGHEPISLRELAGLGGDRAGDRFELVAIGKVVVDEHKELFELDGNLDHRRENHNERAVLLAGVDL